MRRYYGTGGQKAVTGLSKPGYPLSFKRQPPKSLRLRKDFGAFLLDEPVDFSNRIAFEKAEVLLKRRSGPDNALDQRGALDVVHVERRVRGLSILELQLR